MCSCSVELCSVKDLLDHSKSLHPRLYTEGLRRGPDPWLVTLTLIGQYLTIFHKGSPRTMRVSGSRMAARRGNIRSDRIPELRKTDLGFWHIRYHRAAVPRAEPRQTFYSHSAYDRSLLRLTALATHLTTGISLPFR